MADLEEFTTDQLRREIRRREEADRDGRCWYCGKNLAAHTCRYATPSPVPGWEVSLARFVRTEDCMANAVEYWQADARNPVTGKHRIGYGATAVEATESLIARILGRRTGPDRGDDRCASRS